MTQRDHQIEMRRLFSGSGQTSFICAHLNGFHDSYSPLGEIQLCILFDLAGFFFLLVFIICGTKSAF